jgi:hypothetical protein
MTVLLYRTGQPSEHAAVTEQPCYPGSEPGMLPAEWFASQGCCMTAQDGQEMSLPLCMLNGVTLRLLSQQAPSWFHNTAVCVCAAGGPTCTICTNGTYGPGGVDETGHPLECQNCPDTQTTLYPGAKSPDQCVCLTG